ncbi:MAG: TetR/AcrR family transcriptional regulator [Pseudolysinimonas sp.]
MASERAYSMTNRAAAAAVTRDKILRAVLQLATEKLTVEIVLADVAERSGVAVQTILRHFGTRDALFDEAVSYGASEIVDERATPVGDIPKAVEVIMDHYEGRGDWVVALLRQEASDERIRAITEQGKLIHRAWVLAVFGPQLAQRAEPELLTDLLVVATDVSCWKLLRRDRGLGRAATERAMRVLVEAILGASLSESE